MPSKTYKHLFFDLDHTLWDFEKNSHEAISELHQKHGLDELGIPDFNIFHSKYIEINDHLWNKYRKGQIEKEELRYVRFHEALKHFGIDDVTKAKQIGDEYVEISPKKTNLLPFAEEVLLYLSDKYVLHIITNGFEEVQHIKLESSKLNHFFDLIVTSEKAGFKKPSPHIFTYSLKQSGAKRKESLMIGDNLIADVIGAKQIGIDQVFFNPKKAKHQEKLTFEISCLRELKNFL